MNLLDKVRAFFQSSRLDVATRYELDRQATTGTMSRFRVAREIGTGRVVGIKFLDNEKSELFEARFKGLKKPAEGEIAMSINHPRVVETYEFGVTTGGEQYIIMEYIDGPGLNVLVQNQDPRLDGRRVTLMQQMTEAVQAVHEVGYIHRDICPRNFICTADLSELKLIDFGLTVPDQDEFRMPGNRTGTPLYMAPEIVRRRATDKRVDIFALGVTFYRLCSFEHPWGTADTTGKAALAHDTNEPTDISEYCPDIEPLLGDTIMKCLAPAPENRPASAEQVLKNLRRIKQERVERKSDS